MNESEQAPKLDALAEAIWQRRFTDAETIMDKIRSELDASERNRGYLKAFEGLLVSRKSNDDKLLYLNKIEYTKDNIRSLRNEFNKEAENLLHGEYDRGFFSGLSDYLKILEKLEVWKSSKGDMPKP